MDITFTLYTKAKNYCSILRFMIFMFLVFQALEKHKIKLVWDHSVLAILAEDYDVHYGARSIKYEVESRVINQLAAAHEQGIIGNGNIVKLGGSPASGSGSGPNNLWVKLKEGEEFIDSEEKKRSFP
jgi:ATP-dependent Clp protease ATP-binding subunit ClpB